MLYDFTYMWNLKSKTNEQKEQKQSHRYRELTDGYQKKGDGRSRKMGEIG